MIYEGVVCPAGSASCGWTAASGVDGVLGRTKDICSIAAARRAKIAFKMVFMSAVLHDFIVAAAGKRLVGYL